MVGSVVVLYLHSTSNHNSELASEYLITSCIISSFYIKPQLYNIVFCICPRCIISSFYIKPQLGMQPIIPAFVLYYIFILHQTTTYTTYITDIQLFENHIGRYEVV